MTELTEQKENMALRLVEDRNNAHRKLIGKQNLLVSSQHRANWQMIMFVTIINRAVAQPKERQQNLYERNRVVSV